MKRLLLINTIIYLTFACAAQSVDKLLATQVAWANHTQHTTSKAIMQHAAIDTSATEMQTKGVSLDKLVIQLLQKIEELTLYTIQQEERIKELETLIK